jgi:hypothetical protein
VVNATPGRFSPGNDPGPIVKEDGYAPDLDEYGISRPYRDSIFGQSSP